METRQIIQHYIKDAEDIKLKYGKTPQTLKKIWLKEYDELINQLKDIIVLINDDEQTAYNEFTSLKICKYNSFGDYIKATNPSAAKVTFNTRSKTIRKQLICRHCASTCIVVKDGVYICTKCGAEIQNKSNTQLVAKEVSDNTKHIVKQLNALSGRINPPTSISKIMPWLKTWLTDRSYMKKFLEWSNTMEFFKTQYEKLAEEELPVDFFEKKLKETLILPEYSLYKLYTDMFYKLTEKAKEYNSYSSDMTKLQDAQIYEICEAYVKSLKEKNEEIQIPKPGTMFEDHSIGNYIASLMTTTLDLPIKQKLQKLFDNDLIIPGLMFDYKTEYGCKNNTPKKFAYQQNYIFIIHRVYDIQTFDIIEEDKAFICETMNNFNTFIKEHKHNQTGKHHNSCLWQLTLSQVLTLPYFRCYRGIIDVLPIKPSNTTIQIKEAWARYCVINHDKLKKYKTIIRDEIAKEKITIINSEVDDVNYNEVLDFIGCGGKYFNNDQDNYLREKLNVTETKHDWTSKYSYEQLSEIKRKTQDLRRNNTSVQEQTYDEDIIVDAIICDESEDTVFKDHNEETEDNVFNVDMNEIIPSDDDEDEYNEHSIISSEDE